MIYADFNATTPLCKAALSEMNKAMESWGNPSSTHTMGRCANEILEQARSSIAIVTGAAPSQVVFTSGGSEANTLALLGSLFLKPTRFKCLVSKIEHSSVKDTAELLIKNNADIEYAKLLSNGELDLERFEKSLQTNRPDLVSLMTANNETGVLFPMPEIVKLCQTYNVVLHTDAVQALGKVPASFWLGADMVSISAHKIFGPKGIGALIIKDGIQLIPTHYGGSQEIKRRGGTQNMVGIAGFGGACEELIRSAPFSDELRNRFEKTLLEGLDGIYIQSVDQDRIPNTSNIRFAGISAEILMGALDLDGICVSAGSACFSGSVSPSHVLLALGLSPEEAKECLRFSWGRISTVSDVDTVADRVINHVKRIRARRRT